MHSTQHKIVEPVRSTEGTADACWSSNASRMTLRVRSNVLLRWFGLVRPPMGWSDLLLIIAVCMIWGVSVTISKVAVGHFPPLFLLALRFLLAAAVIMPWMHVPFRSLPALFALSVTMGVLHFGCLLLALTHLDASTAAILQQLQVPFGVLIAAAVFGERPGWRRLLGIGIAFAGVVVLIGKNSSRVDGVGVALMIAAAFFCASGNIQMKAITGISPFVTNGWLAILAVPQIALASFMFETRQLDALQSAGWVDVACVLYLAIATTLVGFWLWCRLLQSHPISSLLPFTLTIPLFGVLSGAVLLGEPLGWSLIAGGFITVAGVALVVLTPASRIGSNANKGT